MQAHAVPADGPSANLSWLTLLVKIKKSDEESSIRKHNILYGKPLFSVKLYYKNSIYVTQGYRNTNVCDYHFI